VPPLRKRKRDKRVTNDLIKEGKGGHGPRVKWGLAG